MGPPQGAWGWGGVFWGAPDPLLGSSWGLGQGWGRGELDPHRALLLPPARRSPGGLLTRGGG